MAHGGWPLAIAGLAEKSFSRSAAALSASVRFFLCYRGPASSELQKEVLNALKAWLRALDAAGDAAATGGAADAAAEADLRSHDPALLPAARLGGAQWAATTFLELSMTPARRDAVSAALRDSRLPDVHPRSAAPPPPAAPW